jgi:hypothetical protein
MHDLHLETPKYKHDLHLETPKYKHDLHLESCMDGLSLDTSFPLGAGIVVEQSYRMYAFS